MPLSIAAAVLVLAIYAAALWVMPKGGFYSPDEGAKFIQLNSIDWHDGLRYDIAYGGRDIDLHILHVEPRLLRGPGEMTWGDGDWLTLFSLRAAEDRAGEKHRNAAEQHATVHNAPSGD